MDFTAPSWLFPKESAIDSFIKGSQAGAAIAANRLRQQAIYAEAQQHQQRMDLAERKFVTENEADTLKNDVIRTKLKNDAEDFAVLREWWPKFQSTDTELVPPNLHDENTMLRVANAVTEKKIKIGEAAYAALLARPSFSLAEPENQREYWDLVARYPFIAAKRGPEGLMAPIKIAETLKRQKEEADSRAKFRDEKTYLNQLIEERRRMVADSNVAVDSKQMEEIDSRIAMAKRGMIVKEGQLELDTKKYELDKLESDHNIPLTDEKLIKMRKEVALLERNMLNKEKNTALRERELKVKEQLKTTMGKWERQDTDLYNQRAAAARNSTLAADQDALDQELISIAADVEWRRQERVKFEEAKRAREGSKTNTPPVLPPTPVAPSSTNADFEFVPGRGLVPAK